MPSKEAMSPTLDKLGPWTHARAHASTSARTSSPVLIVDDDVPIRESLAQALRDEGYPVTQAQDGIEALGLLAGSRKRHIIFLDLLMPRMDGIEFCERLMTDPALRHDHAVILMSAWFQHAARVTTVNFARLYKPFDLNEVLELAGRFSAAPTR
jgi:CheY-like chemotaxis protein